MCYKWIENYEKKIYNAERVTALIYIVPSSGFKVKMHESGNTGHLYLRECRGPLPWGGMATGGFNSIYGV